VTAYEIIRSKREGEELPASAIEFIVRGFVEGSVPDYQMSAFLMAVYFRGMTEAETAALTRVMLDSGIALDLSDIDGVKVDKHSTGGVGDKLSLIVAPAAAAAGVRVPMISGRGLGHTGGTLDKLESIPGMSTSFSPRAFRDLVARVGMAIIGQSPELAPADRRMYALRDVTATVECAPLIVGSILSKKFAAGLDALILDIKVGRGAFMTDLTAARDLGRRLVTTAAQLGLRASGLLTDMESPLGRAVGNALEVAEAVEVLKGGGPPDVREVSLALAGRMLSIGGVAGSAAEGIEAARAVLDRGAALEVFERFVSAQGGDAHICDDPGILPRASLVREVVAKRAGSVAGVDALEIGLATVELGAGRTVVGEEIDPAVGIEIEAPVGAEVAAGEPLALVHANDEGRLAAVLDRVRDAFTLTDRPVAAPRRMLEEIGAPAGDVSPD
jgi:pyrimidine-nucleoside phosphorylase